MCYSYKLSLITAEHCLKVEIKSSSWILQTANNGHKGKVSHSLKPKMANFGCILLTSSQSAFRFHWGINHAWHKFDANSWEVAYPQNVAICFFRRWRSPRFENNKLKNTVKQLRIPTVWRKTSWLSTQIMQLRSWTQDYWGQIQMADGGFNPGTSRFQTQHHKSFGHAASMNK